MGSRVGIIVVLRELVGPCGRALLNIASKSRLGQQSDECVPTPVLFPFSTYRCQVTPRASVKQTHLLAQSLKSLKELGWSESLDQFPIRPWEGSF